VLQEPLSDPQPDDPRPDDAESGGSGPAAPSGVPEPEEDLQGPQQGLFVCLPAEELSLAGFAQNGQADTMAPGGLLATVLHTVIGEGGSGLPGLSDDQLIGVLSGGKRMESFAAWVQLAALRELARRRPAVEPGDTGRAGFSDFAGDELMAQFHLTREAATGQIVYACAVADRLPRTFAALAAGRIHSFAVKIIEDETMFLSSDNVAKADEALSDLAQSNSFARLRYAAHRLVLKLDPDYAKRRKDEARKYAHVSRFREDTGNAAISGREMPPDEVLASWQHVEQRALELRAAGVPGTRHPPPGFASVKMVPVARGPCDHAHAEIGYHPSRALQHLIRARSATCTAPGCTRPAARCDLDHTHPWDDGGRTCECNLAPLCRHHHRMKQREGWQLAQKEPGVLVWQTPSGRTYTTTPTVHPA